MSAFKTEESRFSEISPSFAVSGLRANRRGQSRCSFPVEQYELETLNEAASPPGVAKNGDLHIVSILVCNPPEIVEGAVLAGMSYL